MSLYQVQKLLVPLNEVRSDEGTKTDEQLCGRHSV